MTVTLGVAHPWNNEDRSEVMVRSPSPGPVSPTNEGPRVAPTTEGRGQHPTEVLT